MGSQFHLQTYNRQFAVAAICIGLVSFFSSILTAIEPRSTETRTGEVKRSFHVSYPKGGGVDMFVVELENGQTVSVRSPTMHSSSHVIQVSIGKPACATVKTGMLTGDVKATLEHPFVCNK